MATERTKYLELLNRSSLYRLRRIAKSAGLSAEEIVETVGSAEGGEQDAIIKKIMEKYDEGEAELPIPDIREDEKEEEKMPRGRPRKKAVEQHTKQPVETPKQPVEAPEQPVEDAMDDYLIFDDETPTELESTEYDADIPAPTHQCAGMPDPTEILATIKERNEELIEACRVLDNTTAKYINEEVRALRTELRELTEVVKYAFAHVFKMGAARPIPGFAEILKKAKEKAQK